MGEKNCNTTDVNLQLGINLIPSDWHLDESIFIHKACGEIKTSSYYYVN